MPRSLLCGLLFVAFLAVACGGSGKGNVTPPVTVPVIPTLPAGPTPTATPKYEGSIKSGAWVRVVGADGCLNMQISTGLNSPVTNFCEPNGYEGYVVGDPVLSDGHWWWWIAGRGWAQDEHLQFVRSEDLAKRTVPDLSGLGQIAYVGADHGIWLMNSDGSGRRRLVDAPPASSDTFIGRPQWRRDGKELLYLSTTYATSGTSYEVRIIDLNGHEIKRISDATSAFWSPDGERLGALTGAVAGGEGEVRATPAVIDLSTGDVTNVGPEDWFLEGPKWRPDGKELVYGTEQGVIVVNADGSNSQVVIPSTLVQYRPVSWSLDGQQLSIQSYTDACRGYATFAVSTGGLASCAAEPPPDSRRGGRGGSPEDGQTARSPDGKLFGYHTEWAVTDKSGVYVVDRESGQQTLLPGWAAAYVSFAPDSRHVAFSTHGGDRDVIWIGDATTGHEVLQAEGSQPAWRPVRN